MHTTTVIIRRYREERKFPEQDHGRQLSMVNLGYNETAMRGRTITRVVLLGMDKEELVPGLVEGIDRASIVWRQTPGNEVEYIKVEAIE